VAHDDTPLNERLEELLRRRLWQGAAGGEGCGDPELLAAYAEGQLPAAARERMEQHLAACAACQTAVARLVRMAPQESAAAGAGAHAAQPARWSLFRWRWAVPALAGVVLAGLFVFTGREPIMERAKPEAPAPSARHQAAEQEKQEVKTAPQAESSSVSTPAVAPSAAAARNAPRDAEVQVSRDVRGAPAPSAGEKDREEQRQRVAAAKPQQQETMAVGKLQQQHSGTAGRVQQQQPMAAGGEQQQQPTIIGGPQQQQRTTTGRAQQQPSVAAEAAPQLSVAQQAGQRAAPAAAPPAPTSQARAADADRPQQQQGQAAGTLKKEAPQDLLDEARAQKAADTRAKTGAANKMLEQPPGVRSVAPEMAAKRGVVREDAQRAEANEEKASARANVAEGRRGPAPAGGAAAGAAGGIGTSRMSMEARNAAAFGSFRKQVPAGTRQLALTASGQLLFMPAESRVWRPLSIPSGATVVDFTVFGEHLWVLLPGGRVGHSPDLGRSWDPPIETKAQDATSISFTSPRSGEIQTRSGRRLRSTDGGESWHPVR